MKFHQAARLGLVVALAAMLGGCYESPEAVDKKIAAAVAKVQAPPAPVPVTVTLTAPPAPAVPQTATTTVSPKGDIKVDASNPNHTGIQQNVTVNLPTVGQPCCQPKVVAPAPCCQPRPVVKPPAPRTYYKAPLARPAPQRMSSCFVQVDVMGPPTQVDIKDGSGKVVGSANVVGSGRVAVPCSFARAGDGQICLVTGGANAPARNLNPEWFSMAQRNLASGNTLLNAGHPVWFKKKGHSTT